MSVEGTMFLPYLIVQPFAAHQARFADLGFCGVQAECCTCVMVAVSGHIAGVLAISDPLKPEARGVVAALHRSGMACHLATGDNWRTARSIAEQLGIINVTAECLPGAKAEKIKVPSLNPPLSNAAFSHLPLTSTVILMQAVACMSFARTALVTCQPGCNQ